jgi:hypothetical protein
MPCPCGCGPRGEVPALSLLTSCLWLMLAAPRYNSALELLRNFCKGDKPNALELVSAIEQVVGVLKAKGDLMQFLSRPPDSDAVSAAAVYSVHC